MATKPTDLPNWATDGGADITEPSGLKQATGWVDAELPPHDYFNWWQNLVYQWAAYLDDLEAQDFTWAGDHTFSSMVSATLTSNPVSTVAQTNKLTAKNLPKVWVRLTFGGGSVTIDDGFGITSAAVVGSGATSAIRLTFAQAFAGTNFVPLVVAAGAGNPSLIFSFGNQTTTTVDIFAGVASSGTQTDFSSASGVLGVTIFGVQ